MEICEAAVRAGTSLYGVEPGALRARCGSGGSVYEYEQEGEGRILKFVPVAPEDVDQVHERWAFAAYLAGHGVRVCRPLSSEGGALLEVAQGEDRTWAVTLSVRMPGEHPEWGAGRRVGRAVGGGARIVRG